MTVLALDLATRAGWALHAIGMERPLAGTLDLSSPPGVCGPAMEKLRTFLARAHEQHGPFTHIVFEQRHLDKEHSNLNSVKKLIAIDAMAEWFAFKMKKLHGTECREVNILQWRNHFLGTAPARFSKGSGRRFRTWNGQLAKAAALEVCERYGWPVDSDDAAEACGILDYFLALLGDNHHPRPWTRQLILTGQRRG